MCERLCRSSSLWESQRRALGSVQSRDEKARQSFLFPHTSVMPRPCSLDMMRGRGIRRDRYPSVQQELKFRYRSISAGFNMSKIHLRTFEVIRERQGRLFKAFSCVKLLVFLLICYSLILKCPPLCIFTDSLTHWQSQIVSKPEERNTTHTHKMRNLVFSDFQVNSTSQSIIFFPAVLNYGSPNLHLFT